MKRPAQILGIVNITRDSFSDGGRYLATDAAVAHARRLWSEGADWIDLGAESTHPEAEDVPAEVEIARLAPVIQALARETGAAGRISVDTWKPAVMRHVLSLGVGMINNVTGFADPESIAAVRDSETRLVVMHARRTPRVVARADRQASADPGTIVDEIIDFFRGRVAQLEAAGIHPARLILDPGMGVFLGPDPAASLAVLRDLSRLKALGLPLLVSTSRKGFIGAVLARDDAAQSESKRPRPSDQRSAGTLATEVWAALQGVDYIRTHEAGPLRDALRMLAALAD